MVNYSLIWKREYSFFYGVCALRALQQWIKTEEKTKFDVLGEGEKGWFYTFADKAVLEKLNKLQQYNLQHNPALVRQHLANLHPAGEQFVQQSRQKSQQKTQDPHTLISLMDDFYHEYAAFCFHLWNTFMYAENAAKAFEQFLKEHCNTEDFFAAAKAYSIPGKQTTLALLSEYFQKVKGQKQREEYVHQNCPWLQSADPFTQPLTLDWIPDLVRSYQIVPVQKSNDSFGHAADPFIQIYQEVLYVKDKRDEYRRQAFYYILPLVQELSKVLHLPVIDLQYLLPQEYLLPNLKEIINARKQGYVIELNNDLKITAGKEVILQFLHHLHTHNDAIKGVVACQGLVEGEVQIITSKNQIPQFKAGNILVTTTTDPDHLPAMHKAVAFITDEGGLTCHAAIVARELGKPCIVGTGNATTALRDGDVVRVDAVKGIVKIIKTLNK